MKSCGLLTKPLIYIERKKPDELYAYVSEDSEEKDVEWMPQQEKKKKQERKQDEMLNECKFSFAIPIYYKRNLPKLMVFSLHSHQDAFSDIKNLIIEGIPPPEI